LEYKFTLGSWGSVEKTVEGAEVPNRRWKVAGDAVIDATVSAWAKPATPRANTGVGDLRWRNFSSEILKSDRKITVWLPPQYQQSDTMRFPVVYLLDGQNVFDAARAAYGMEWRADEAATELADSFNALILVAIDNSPERMNEYTPVAHIVNDRQVGGKADDYLQFLCEELKPWIDSEFPTRTEPEHTTIVGSSLGGLFVLHAMTTRSDVFGNGITMSPSLFWGEAATVQRAKSWSPPTELSSPLRLWVDMGTREGKSEKGQKQLIDGVKELESILQTRGGESLQVHLVIAEDAQHNEDAWAKRLPDALRFASFGELDNP
jgi:predicted alpha/beta superfamily hydrolase